MRKIVPLLSFMACLIVPVLAFGLEVAVEITGPQELSSLKEGIGKSVTTRCITKGIALDKYGKLTINISKLGDVISYDAILDTIPARAYHKDLKDTSALSSTIDEMIGAIFIETVKTPIAPARPAKAAPGQESASRIKLPFVATSIAAVKEKMFVCDTKRVYELKGDMASPLWEAPGNNEILRIYPYGDSLIVLTKLMNECRAFMIMGHEVKNRWNKAVLPLGDGLISTSLKFDKIFGITPYMWSEATQEAGSPPHIPHGLDIISAVLADVKISSPGAKIISYDTDNSLTISDGKSILWTDDTSSGNTPQFIEDEYISRGSSQREPPKRYYLKPRIVVIGEKIITFRNGQGMAKMVPGLNLFDYSQILAYTPSGNALSKDELATFPDSYCPDITAAQGKIAALIVKKDNTYVQFLGL